MLLRALLLIVAVIGLGACVPPVTPLEKLTNAAYELNSATRFGRMDVAIMLVEADQQVDFARRHAKWGADIRIVDVELTGLRPLTSDTAEATLTITWHRLDETIIEVSAVSQKWAQQRDGWRLVEERRTGGAPGVFVQLRQKGAGQQAAAQVDKPAS